MLRGLIAFVRGLRYVDVYVNFAESRTMRACRDRHRTRRRPPRHRSRELAVPAEDGTELAATLFEPGIAAAAEAPLVVIGGARR